MYLPPNPLTYYYYWKAIDYQKTCETLLDKHMTNELPIPNPFSRKQFIVCKSDDNDGSTVYWETQTCCQDYVFCMKEGRCVKKQVYFLGCGGKDIHYITANPIKLSLNEFDLFNDEYER